MSDIIKIEESRSKFAGHDDIQVKRNINYRDRAGHDFIGWSRHDPAEGNYKGGKKSNFEHPSAGNNGNLTYWDA